MTANPRTTRANGGPGTTLSQLSQRTRTTRRSRPRLLNARQRGCLYLLPFFLIIFLAIRSVLPGRRSHQQQKQQNNIVGGTHAHTDADAVRQSKTHHHHHHQQQHHHHNHHNHHNHNHGKRSNIHNNHYHRNGHHSLPKHAHAPVGVSDSVHSGHKHHRLSVHDGHNKHHVNSIHGSGIKRMSHANLNDLKVRAAVATGRNNFNEPLPPISAIVLFHAEYPTLIHTLDSWEKNGLLPSLSEVIFFLNGIKSRKEFDERLPRLASDPQWQGKSRVVASPENLPLGLAIREMVRISSHDFVLLLEKDWALIEPAQQVRAQLLTSVDLLKNGQANLVRFRHRERPGAPLHARIMHQGREPQMLRQQSNLYCFMHHWIKDLDTKYPAYFSKCQSNFTLSEPVWCSKARYCQWTNNPGLFYKRWFMENLGDPFLKDYEETKRKDPTSGHLDFEFYMNWNEKIWNGRDYVVALPRGLFEHQEVGEQNLQNTVWYGWNRLSTDCEEKMNEYFETEQIQCETRKTHASGVKYEVKFPLDFVHLYHYDRAMTRTREEAVSELDVKVKELNHALEVGQSNWRVGITDLTNLHYEKVLFSYPVEPASMKLAFVTIVYKPDQYDSAVANMNRLKQYAMVVYGSEEHARKIRSKLEEDHGWDEGHFDRVKFVTEATEDLVKRMLGEYVISNVDKLRNEEEWRKRVGERSGGTIPDGLDIKVRLSKPLLLRDVERMGSTSGGATHGVTHIIWFDSTSRCIAKGEKGLTGKDLMGRSDHVLRGHMVLNTMVSGKYVSNMNEMEAMMGRWSGFDSKMLLGECEVSEISRGLQMIDGRTIGGSRLGISLMVGYYDFVLRDLLHKGQLGTEREYLTIAHRNVEYNFKFVDGWSLCPRGKECGGVAEVTRDSSAAESNEGCRIYEWANRCALQTDGQTR